MRCAVLILILGLLSLASSSVAAPDSVRYATPDGFQVHGLYYRPSAPTTRAALILPDAGEGKEAWNSLADSLAGYGFHVLSVDLRGTGESVMQRGIRRDRASFTTRERAAGAIDGQAGMRYLRTLRQETIRQLVVIGSGAGTAGALGSQGDEFDRLVVLLVSPRGLDGVASPTTVEGAASKRLLIVVTRDDLLGVEASAQLVRGRAARDCWVAEGRNRGAEFLGGRMDLFRACVGWIDDNLDSAGAAR